MLRACVCVCVPERRHGSSAAVVTASTQTPWPELLVRQLATPAETPERGDCTHTAHAHALHLHCTCTAPALHTQARTLSAAAGLATSTTACAVRTAMPFRGAPSSVATVHCRVHRTLYCISIAWADQSAAELLPRPSPHPPVPSTQAGVHIPGGGARHPGRQRALLRLRRRLLGRPRALDQPTQSSHRPAVACEAGTGYHVWYRQP